MLPLACRQSQSQKLQHQSSRIIFRMQVITSDKATKEKVMMRIHNNTAKFWSMRENPNVCFSELIANAMLVSSSWLAKSGCQYQLRPGFANSELYSVLLLRDIWQAGSGWSWIQRERPENVNIYQLSDFTFESWRGLSQWRLCVVVWVWGSDWGRDCGGQESDTVSVSGQPQWRAQYRCTVCSTECGTERSVNLSQEREVHSSSAVT